MLIVKNVNRRPRFSGAVFFSFTLFVAVGCRSKPIVVDVPSLQANVAAPRGWLPSTQPTDGNARHIVWNSPTGDTAFGVIRFSLPFPVGHRGALWGYLNAMRRAEGEATVLDERWDASDPSLRFIVTGGKYTVANRMIVRGVVGWVFYAGTLRARGVNEAEFRQAAVARDASSPE